MTTDPQRIHQLGSDQGAHSPTDFATTCARNVSSWAEKMVGIWMFPRLGIYIYIDFRVF